MSCTEEEYESTTPVRAAWMEAGTRAGRQREGWVGVVRTGGCESGMLMGAEAVG
jgi:hypothetical protein